MTIKLDEKDHVVCVWFADDVDGNNMMMLLRRREDQYVQNVRLRWRVDEKIYNSMDKKDFYQTTFKPGVTEETALTVCDSFWAVTSEVYCMHQIRQRVDGGVREFAKAMEKYDAFHSKKVPKETPVDSDSQKSMYEKRWVQEEQDDSDSEKRL